MMRDSAGFVLRVTMMTPGQSGFIPAGKLIGLGNMLKSIMCLTSLRSWFIHTVIKIGLGYMLGKV